MGGVYKIKKGCGCKMCKPHKGGLHLNTKRNIEFLKKPIKEK
jgi:hypothetical protein